MDTKMKWLVGGLIAVNVGLMGLLLFPRISVAPARAEHDPAAPPSAAAGVAAPAVTAPPVLEERAGGTAFASHPAAAAPGEGAAAAPPLDAAPERIDAHTDAYPEVPPAATARAETRPLAPARRERAPARREPAARVAPREVTRSVSRLPDDDFSRAERASAERASDAYAEREDEDEPEMGRDEARERPVERPLPPRPITVTVPAGAHLPVRLDVALHSRQVRSGDRFEASLAQDLVVEGKTVARAGSPVTGRIVEVHEAGRVKGREEMKLTLSELTLAGKTYEVDTSTLGFSAKDDTDRDAALIGASTAVGAIIGAITKGDRGAAAGAATGAAAGTGVVLSTKGRAVVLSSGTKLDFTLEDQVRVTLPPSQSPSQPYGEEQDEDADRDDAGVARR